MYIEIALYTINTVAVKIIRKLSDQLRETKLSNFCTHIAPLQHSCIQSMHIWNISFSLTSYTSTSFLVVCTQESFNLMSTVDDDQPDEWDQRIINTGCHEENLKLQLCHADTGDWRKCLEEMAAFRKCWEVNNNNERTKTVNNEEKWK